MSVLRKDRKYKTVQELWDMGFQHTAHHVHEYHLNHAYLEGYQWLEWHPVELQVMAPVDDSDRIKATINHMRSNLRTLVSQLTQRNLSFEVQPSAYDDVSMRAAKIAEGDLRDASRKHGWESKREGLCKAALKGGTAVIAVDWSKSNDDTVETVLGIPEFVVAPGSRDIHKARWWIKLQLLPPSDVKAMWPDHFKGEEVPPSDGRLGNSTGYEFSTTDGVDLTRVYTYYERPNPLTPEGCVKVEVGGKCLEEGEWNFPFKDRLNISEMRESITENDAYGTTIISDCRSPQTALNAAWSSYLEHMRQAGNTRMVLDESWEDALASLRDIPGDPLVGPMAKGKPEWMKAPGAPTVLLDGIQMLTLVLDNLMGVHDVSRGSAPANIESGYGLSILAEKDSSPVGRLIKETARVFSDVAWMRLELIQNRSTRDRTTTIIDGQGPVMRKWTGKDIRGETNALVPIDAIVPRSQAAQAQFAMKSVEMGMINPEDPLAVMRFAKLADMPDQRGIINALLPDAAKAIRENEAVVTGEVPFPREFDDHQMHNQIHNEFRKTIQYELLGPEGQAILDDHMTLHDKLIQEALGQARKAQAIDPALGGANTAEGGPVPEPLLPPPPPEGGGDQTVPPDVAMQDMLGAMQMPQ